MLLTAAMSAQQRPRARRPRNSRRSPIRAQHHPDVLEDRPGVCPLCKLALVPVRLDSSWMCPVHTAVIESERGTCRLCRRQLVPVTVSLTWSCRGDTRGAPRARALQRRLAPDRTARATAARQPQSAARRPVLHGAGQLASHRGGLSGRASVSALRVRRLWPSAASRRIEGRPGAHRHEGVVRSRNAQDDRASRRFPLRVSRNRGYLEARVDHGDAPGGDDRESAFRPRVGRTSFRLHVRRVYEGTGCTDVSAPAHECDAVQPACRAAGRHAAPRTSPDARTPASVRRPIPRSMAEILEELRGKDAEVRELIARGDFAAVWVPAFRAKDLAIALEPHLAHLAAPEARRWRAGARPGRSRSLASRCRR